MLFIYRRSNNIPLLHLNPFLKITLGREPWPKNINYASSYFPAIYFGENILDFFSNKNADKLKTCLGSFFTL